MDARTPPWCPKADVLMLKRRSNPQFDLSNDAIRDELARMARTPRPLQRPVIVLAGWRSPHFTPAVLARSLAALTSGSDADFLVLSYLWTGRFDRAVEHVRCSVRARHADAPVDVVAISMGGLVARAAARSEPESSKPLHIARLFTLSTPHRGATLARFVRPDDCARVMKPGSQVIQKLDAELSSAAYELICYGQPRDWWIGDQTQAPVGRPLHWADTNSALWRIASHFCVNRNRLIIADLARRLRGEDPIARGPHRGN